MICTHAIILISSFFIINCLELLCSGICPIFAGRQIYALLFYAPFILIHVRSL